MSLSMLFEFPGILITIGVVLLIVSIIIGVIAYKKDEALDISADTLNDPIKEKDVPVKEENKEQEENTFEFSTEEEIENNLEEVEVPKELINNSTAYGGIEPTDRIDLNKINNKKRFVYGEELKDEEDEQTEITVDENKEIEEDIELL